MREGLIAIAGIFERIIGKSLKPRTAGTTTYHTHIQNLVNTELKESINSHNGHIKEYNQLHGDINAVHVSSHLLMRHTQLHLVEQLTREHQVHSELEKKYADEKSFPLRDPEKGQGAQNTGLHPAERAYRLAVTDLFVEKAQGFLEERAISYQRSGKIARRLVISDN